VHLLGGELSIVVGLSDADLAMLTRAGPLELPDPEPQKPYLRLPLFGMYGRCPRPSDTEGDRHCPTVSEFHGDHEVASYLLRSEDSDVGLREECGQADWCNYERVEYGHLCILYDLHSTAWS
jgi:hypothetical protein